MSQLSGEEMKGPGINIDQSVTPGRFQYQIWCWWQDLRYTNFTEPTYDDVSYILFWIVVCLMAV